MSFPNGLAAHPTATPRLWMDLFADWTATKRDLIETLRLMIASGAIELLDLLVDGLRPCGAERRFVTQRGMSFCIARGAVFFGGAWD
jgi:hypothetical protein